MSETRLEAQQTPIRQSYEEVRDGAKGSGVEQWRAVDKTRAELGELYRDLQGDARYSEEYKAETAWRRYQQAREEVERLAPEAKRLMEKSADGLYAMSIPRPEGELLFTKSKDDLLLTQGERQRLEGLVARAAKSGKGPLKKDPRDILSAEYERALDEGGPSGGATVRAIVGLTRDYGYDLDRIVDKHRRPSQRGALEDAEQARMRASMVSARVPQPPFPHPDEGRRDGSRVGTYGPRPKNVANRSSSLGSASGGPLFQKKRKPSWK